MKAIVVINPNNPTGSILSLESMKEIIRFAHKHRIVIVADEVYQHNIYFGNTFTSFRKAALTIEAPYNNVSVISLNSISKGYTGECGVRGGYMQFHNVDPEVMKQVHKLRDACSVNVAGSIAMGVMAEPPSTENASKEVAEQFAEEKEKVLNMLEKKAKMAMEMLGECKNVECRAIMGGLYAYPRVLLPDSVVRRARECGQEPCEYFCKAMLEKTGVVTVPGCGFGQKAGTYHFRMSLLIWDLQEFAKVLQAMKSFISEFFETHK